MEDILLAIYSDTTKEYISDIEPDAGEELVIKIRVPGKNTEEVSLVVGEETIRMKRKIGLGFFAYYVTTVVLTDRPLEYHFSLIIDGKRYYYGFTGLQEASDDGFTGRQFLVVPGYKTPDWAKGAVYYQIYVDRFCNGDPDNDVVTGEYKYLDDFVHARKWDEPIVSGTNDHYGGDLKGVMDKLYYLRDLGVDVIYLNPIFLSPSNHKYDTADYDHVDPHFGVIVNDGGELLDSVIKDNAEATRYIKRITDKENLEESDRLLSILIEEAHENNMRVILDGVFNHCGSFSKWMDAERIYENTPGVAKGAYIAQNSPYHDFFKFDGGNWPYNTEYEAWWGYKTLPKLNYKCKELYEYILKVGSKWVSKPYCADGWRLDVAADLGPDEETNHRFWKDFRKTVKSANPDAIILAEHYGDASPWLRGGQWDTVMNYDAFMEPVSWFLTGMEKHNDEYREELAGDTKAFWESMLRNSATMSMPSLQTAMNELSNHDHSRFLTRTTRKVGRVETLGSEAADTGTDKAVFRQAVLIQMTWIGAPTIYYADEAGVGGFTDPDNRRVYPWGDADKECIEYHRKLIRIRKECAEYREGSLIPIPTKVGLLAYARKSDTNVSVIAINTTGKPVNIKLPVWMLGIGKGKKYERRICTDNEGYDTREVIYKDEAGVLTLSLKAGGGMIVRYAGHKKWGR